MAIGSPLYMAPELFVDDFGDKYGLPVDVYAYGVVVYGIISANEKMTLDGKDIVVRSIAHLLMNVDRGARLKRTPEFTDFQWDLIASCWDRVPERRPTFDEIVEKLKTNRASYGLPGAKMSELQEYEERIAAAERRASAPPPLKTPPKPVEPFFFPDEM
jgi:serine/threonine protein kinase